MSTITAVKLGRSALSALESLERQRFTMADLPSARGARERWADHRAAEGMTSAVGVPFTTAPSANSKLAKGPRPVVSISLAPGIASGHDVCPDRSGGCTAPCVGGDLVGRATMFPKIMQARACRTRFALTDPAAALALVIDETERETYRRQGRRRIGRRRVGLRLNAFSDIDWTRVLPELADGLPFVDLYDYTKRTHRTPSDRYRLIYSATENDGPAELAAKLARGPLAIVVDTPKHTAPNTIGNYPAVDGDDDDYTNAQHPPGTVITLALKGNTKAKHHARHTQFARTPKAWEHLFTNNNQ